MTLAEMEIFVAECRRLERLVDVLAGWLAEAHDRIDALEAANAAIARAIRVPHVDGDALEAALETPEMAAAKEAVAACPGSRRQKARLRDRDPDVVARWDRLRLA